MAKKELSDWINENVKDDAVWGKFFVIAHKEEYKTGSRIRIEQTVSPIKDATITGKEVKQYLTDKMSSASGIFCLILGIVWSVAAILSRKPMESSTAFFVIMILVGVSFIIIGILLSISANNTSPKIMSISSQKVFNEEVENRKKEQGEQGAGYAGYYCLAAKDALEGNFDKAQSNFGLAEDLKASLVQAASTVPESGLELSRR